MSSELVKILQQVIHQIEARGRGEAPEMSQGSSPLDVCVVMITGKKKKSSTQPPRMEDEEDYWNAPPRRQRKKHLNRSGRRGEGKAEAQDGDSDEDEE